MNLSPLGAEMLALSPEPTYTPRQQLRFLLRRCSVRCVFSSQPQALTLDVPQPGIAGWRAVSRTLRSTLLAVPDALACAIFPSTCSLCAEPLLRLSRVPVCDACWADLPAQSGSLCLSCGEALGAHAFAGADRAPGDYLCRPCRVVPPRFARAVAHGVYSGTMRALLHLLKYEGMEPVSLRLGALITDQVAAQPALPEKLTLVPVPLFAGKRRDRGYNQAELLAAGAAKAARGRGLDWQMDAKLLKRARATESQAGLTLRQRRDNVRGAFFVPGSRRDRDHVKGAKASLEIQRLAGKDLLLIDDIYTTGATARACSLALREAGAASVWVATAARAQKIGSVTPPELAMEQDVSSWGAASLPVARQTHNLGLVPH